MTLNGDIYTGTRTDGTKIFELKINDNATYTFTALANLDHADAANPDDTIILNFGFTAQDSDNDTASGIVRVTWDDDGPAAHDDQVGLSRAAGREDRVAERRL